MNYIVLEGVKGMRAGLVSHITEIRGDIQPIILMGPNPTTRIYVVSFSGIYPLLLFQCMHELISGEPGSCL
jgi:hypothetical protein